MMLISLGEFEFSRSVIFESSKGDEVAPELAATAFWGALGLGCLEMAFLAVALRFLLPADKLHLLTAATWFALYLPATYVTASLTGIDQGRGRFGRFSLFQVMPGAVYVLAILCVIWPTGHISPQSFALVTLAGVISTALLRSSLDWKRIWGARPTFTLASGLLRRSCPWFS